MLRRFPTTVSRNAAAAIRKANTAAPRRPLAASSLVPPRPISALPQTAMGLYRPDQEKDSCGVGLVAHLKRKQSRDIVVDANEMLVG
jgi:hypothetical protein